MSVYSTNPGTVRVPHQAKWVSLLEDRRCLANKVYVFTDGSSKGGFGAVVVTRACAKKYAGFSEPTSTRNVGAELDGLLLGLEHAPRGSEVIVVSDYLGIAAWMTGNWKIKDQLVRGKIEHAMAIAEDRDLLLSFVHHAGHQDPDESDFSYWNHEADRLASLQTEFHLEEQLNATGRPTEGPQAL